jgi:hypothetical protein
MPVLSTPLRGCSDGGNVQYTARNTYTFHLGEFQGPGLEPVLPSGRLSCLAPLPLAGIGIVNRDAGSVERLPLTLITMSQMQQNAIFHLIVRSSV